MNERPIFLLNPHWPKHLAWKRIEIDQIGRKFVIARGYLELKFKCASWFVGHVANRSVINNQFCHNNIPMCVKEDLT